MFLYFYQCFTLKIYTDMKKTQTPPPALITGFPPLLAKLLWTMILLLSLIPGNSQSLSGIIIAPCTDSR